MLIHLSSTLSFQRESVRILLFPLGQSCTAAAPSLDLVPLKWEGDLAREVGVDKGVAA